MPMVPNFIRGERMMRPDQELVSIISSGKGLMPSFDQQLSREEILNVLAYIRTLQQ